MTVPPVLLAVWSAVALGLAGAAGRGVAALVARLRGGGWLELGVGIVAGLWVYALLVVTLPIASGLGFSLPGTPSLQEPVVVASLVAQHAGALTPAFAASRATLGLVRPRARDLGLAVAGATVAIATSAGWVALLDTAGWTLTTQASRALYDGLDPAARLALALMLCTVTPLSEELLFRGWLLGRLAPLVGAPVAVVATSAAFALLHLDTPWTLPPLFVLGVVSALLRLRTGSLWPSLGLHALNNAVALGLPA